VEVQKTRQQMQKVINEADCLFSQEAVQRAIVQISVEITAALENKNPIIMTVMNGGLVFCGQLVTHLAFPLQVDYIHATRYRDQVRGGQLDWLVEPSIEMKGRAVLVVDDILDEGHTLKAILDYCEQQGAESVHSAVLTNKQHDRKAFSGFKADFEGLQIEDRFVFGYGMDYQGYWRNAPGIFAVKGL